MPGGCGGLEGKAWTLGAEALWGRAPPGHRRRATVGAAAWAAGQTAVQMAAVEAAVRADANAAKHQRNQIRMIYRKVK